MSNVIFFYRKEKRYKVYGIGYTWLDVDYFRDYTGIKLRIHGDSRSFLRG